MSPLVCDFEPARHLFFSDNIPSLVYYSHFSAILISIALTFLLFMRGGKELSVKVLMLMILPFVSWIFLDSIFWASNRSDIIMFVWSLQILVEPITYLAATYLTFILVKEKDLSFKSKIFLSAVYAPLVILTPTKFFLPAFNISDCLSIETLWSYYTYVIESLSIIWIALFAMREFARSKSPQKRGEIAFLSIGVVLFLLSFASGNIIGSLTGDWNIAQIGLIGAPILMGFLVYTVVRFKIFKVKIIATQALTVILWLSLCSILFLETSSRVRIIVSITLALFLVVGMLLVRSVKREVEQREKIEKLAEELEKANFKLKELDQLKSEFLSLATHQIRAPLTAVKGYSSMLLEGDFGVLPQKARDASDTIFKSTQNLINIVNDFLNISRIEQGRMVYEKSIFDIVELTKEVAKELEPNVKKANLSLDLNIPIGLKVEVNADRGKVKQVIGNLVDNAIKYTVKGGINISIETNPEKVFIKVKDTGIGIAKEEIGKLFNKFTRAKDANKTNVIGTGLGLYIAKKMIEAHKGDITIESEGLGHGTTFIVEIPKIKS